MLLIVRSLAVKRSSVNFRRSSLSLLRRESREAFRIPTRCSFCSFLSAPFFFTRRGLLRGVGSMDSSNPLNGGASSDSGCFHPASLVDEGRVGRMVCRFVKVAACRLERKPFLKPLPCSLSSPHPVPPETDVSGAVDTGELNEHGHEALQGLHAGQAQDEERL